MNPSLTYKLPSTGALTVEVSEVAIHPEPVLAWREAEFKRMGFVDFVADFLASTRIDLHMMQDLLEAGCPHREAAEILIGTAWYGEDEQWRWTGEAEYFARDEEDQSDAAA